MDGKICEQHKIGYISKCPTCAFEEKRMVIDTLRLEISKLTDDERMEIFEDYCRDCGCNDRGCHCTNDL